MRFQISAFAISYPGQRRVPPLVYYILIEVLQYAICFILKRLSTSIVILTITTNQILEVINKDIICKTENVKEKMKRRSHLKHAWHSYVIFLLVIKAFKLRLLVVYLDRNMYLLYSNDMVMLTAF